MHAGVRFSRIGAKIKLRKTMEKISEKCKIFTKTFRVYAHAERKIRSILSICQNSGSDGQKFEQSYQIFSLQNLRYFQNLKEIFGNLCKGGKYPEISIVGAGWGGGRSRKQVCLARIPKFSNSSLKFYYKIHGQLPVSLETEDFEQMGFAGQNLFIARKLTILKTNFVKFL